MDPAMKLSVAAGASPRTMFAAKRSEGHDSSGKPIKRKGVDEESGDINFKAFCEIRYEKEVKHEPTQKSYHDMTAKELVEIITGMTWDKIHLVCSHLQFIEPDNFLDLLKACLVPKFTVIKIDLDMSCLALDHLKFIIDEITSGSLANSKVDINFRGAIFCDLDGIKFGDELVSHYSKRKILDAIAESKFPRECNFVANTYMGSIMRDADITKALSDHPYSGAPAAGAGR